MASRLIVGSLVATVAFHLAGAASIPVPRVVGFTELVQFVRQAAPTGHVFYDGVYNGVFTFYLRAGDPGFQRGVILGSKLLYATRIEPRFGAVERVASTTDVVERIRHRCGCRLLVVERQVGRGMGALQAPQLLRRALGDGPFRLLRSFSVRTPDVSDVDVYEAPEPRNGLPLVELPFPAIGEGATYEVKPFGR